MLWKVVQLTGETSKHPVARAIALKAGRELSRLGLQLSPDDQPVIEVKTSTSSQGLGLLCQLVVQGDPCSVEQTISVAIGNSSFIAPLTGLELSQAEFLLRYGPEKTTWSNTIDSFVLINGSFAMSLVLQDRIRDEAKDVVQKLKRRGYQVGMVGA